MPVRVGILDSGLPASHGWVICEARNFVGDADAVIDRLGHGSGVLETIGSSDAEVEFCIARIFDDRLSTDTSACAAAIEWLVGLAPRLVNLSFGLRRNDDRLREACELAVAQGIGLVAASPAQGDPVFPAAYSGVVRATGDARCDRNETAFLGSEQADFGGWVGDSRVGPAGASIGCASVSGRLVRLAAGCPDAPFENLVDKLKGSAEYRGVERKGRPL